MDAATFCLTCSLLFCGELEHTTLGERMGYLLRWIQTRSNYSAQVSLPKVRFIPPETIQQNYSNPKTFWQSNVFAVYDGWNQTIVLPTTFSLPFDEGALVHELVHHLQRMHGRKFPCLAEMEREAYLIQRRYVLEYRNGAAPSLEFISKLRCIYQYQR